MHLYHRATKKEFAREIFLGSLAVVCLFAIFLFVAIQQATGRSLSPLAYLWPTEKNIAEDGIPVVVFKTEKDRQEALSQSESPKPRLEAMVTQFQQSTARHREKQMAKEKIRQPENQYRQVQQNAKEIPAVRLDRAVVEKSVPRRVFLPAAAPLQKSQGNSGAPKNQTRIVQSNPSPLATAKPLFSRKSKTRDRVQSPNATLAQPKSQPEISQKTFQPIQTEFKAVPAIFEPSATRGNTFAATHVNFSANQRVAPAQENGLKNALGTTSGQFKNQWLRVTPKTDDSFWTLSVDHYNHGKYFAALARFNGCADNIDDLPKNIWIPPLTTLTTGLPVSQGEALENPSKVHPGFYLTRGGENLFDIARESLGAAARFAEILKSNAAQLPPNCDAQTVLKKGIRLKLPPY
jgi:hypothetical protein